jgi:uncharacterized peroxidase-related enzyme
MRLPEVESGGNFGTRLLIKFISSVSGMRLPDAARIVIYYKDFYGDPMAEWTHATMRGESGWTVGERELMAAMTAKWNSCAFCVQAHSAIASLVFEPAVVQTTLHDFQHADLPPKVKTMLHFLEKAALWPDHLAADDVWTLMAGGVGAGEIEDALAVLTLFSITVRCADALNFALLSEKDTQRAAKRLLGQGYAFGKTKTPAHPDHHAMAEALRRRVLEGPGETAAALRQAMAKRAAGGAAIDAPYDQIALQIGKDAYKITDEQVKALVAAVGSDKAAFELIVSAAVGAGLLRWQKGLELLTNATSPDH